MNKKEKKTLPGLVIYARVDGAFSIWDPARYPEANMNGLMGDQGLRALNFTRENIWDGLRVDQGAKSISVFNGLIIDWVHWQTTNNEAFQVLKKVIKKLSPPDLEHGDLGPLVPGNIVRVPGESRPMPTIVHPYGEVPIIYASAAVKRIIALSYLIVWTWEEHKMLSSQIKEMPQNNMIVIADEIEAHLHPQWQRVILPALTEISNELSRDLKVQFLLTTHSPLVLASAETIFESSIDEIFHINLGHDEFGELIVLLENPNFVKRGSADSWLVSELFELRQPRSIEAENYIEIAKKIFSQSRPQKSEIVRINSCLHKVLPSHDLFWIRWNRFLNERKINISSL